jgi:hypothetical protein
MKHSLRQRSRKVNIVLIQVVPVLVDRPLIDRVPRQVLGSWGPHLPEYTVDSLQFRRGVTGHPVLTGLRKRHSEHLSSKCGTEVGGEWGGGFDQPLLVVDLCHRGRIVSYCYSKSHNKLLL